MYELILHAQISSTRHEQVLQILAGVTAMQPVDFSEQVLIFQKLKSAETAAASKKKASGQNVPPMQRLQYHKLVRDIETSNDLGKWKLLVEETPVAGIKDVNARTVVESIVEGDQLARFRPGSEWYKFVNQYITKGSRFVHGNVVIRLSRHYPVGNHTLTQDPLDSKPPSKQELEPLDKSGTRIVEAYVRTEDGPSPTLREKATDELLRFARQLEGAIDLRPVNRLALDTAVKGG